jgi:hypothetical protein
MRAEVLLDQWVTSMRDQRQPNLTETSAYNHPFSVSPHTPSPATHAGVNPFAPTRAHAPTQPASGATNGCTDAMDCSEDVKRGEDGQGEPPSCTLYTLFARHVVERQTPPSEGMDTDPPPGNMLIGNPAQPRCTPHSDHSRVVENDGDATPGMAGTTNLSLAAVPTPEIPRRAGGYPPAA